MKKGITKEFAETLRYMVEEPEERVNILMGCIAMEIEQCMNVREYEVIDYIVEKYRQSEDNVQSLIKGRK